MSFPRLTSMIVSSVVGMLVAGGCSSTKITDRQELVTEQLPRPARIWVHDFISTVDGIPDGSALSGQDIPGASGQSQEHVAVGRQLGAEIATQLTERIRAMGLPAEHAMKEGTPQINDIVIQGYLLSIKEGDASKRVELGLGSGASELKVAAEGFQMTDRGLRKLGSGDVESGSGKTPGMAVGVATLIATHNPVGLIVSTGMKVYGEETGSSKVEGRARQIAEEISGALKERFRQQGWIE